MIRGVPGNPRVRRFGHCPCLKVSQLEHLMDIPNRSARAHRTEFGDLMANGLILWRLAWGRQSDLWCLVFEHPNGLCFVLDDDPQGTLPYTDYGEHADIVSLVKRTDELKTALMQCGWTELDVE
jgi:hypothetical protein